MGGIFFVGERQVSIFTWSDVYCHDCCQRGNCIVRRVFYYWEIPLVHILVRCREGQ